MDLCPKCNRAGFTKAGPRTMHVKFCKGAREQDEILQENVALAKKHTFVSRGAPKEVVPKAIVDYADSQQVPVRELLAMLGSHVAVEPNGILLTSKYAKSYLTQFCINLEATLKWARALLKLVDEQEIANWRKEKGFDE